MLTGISVLSLQLQLPYRPDGLPLKRPVILLHGLSNGTWGGFVSDGHGRLKGATQLKIEVLCAHPPEVGLSLRRG